MNKIDMTIIITLVVVLACMAGGVVYVSNVIRDGGGVKAIIIDAGKEIKQISKEIDNG